MIATLLLMTATLHAAMLHATIVDTEGQGIPGANLVLTGSNLGASSNLSGQVDLHHIPAGTYRLEISCLGYETINIEMTFTETDMLQPVLEMQSTTLDLEEVEVSGTAGDGLNTSNNRAVERISELELQSYAGGGGVLQAIGECSGVDSKPCGLCGSAGVGLQGLDASYTEVQIDGLNLMSGVGALYGMESIRTQGIAIAELQRGSTDPAQGGSAIAGSVNLRSSRIATVDTVKLNLALGDDYRHEIGLSIERQLFLPTRLDLNWSADPTRIDRDGDLLTDTPQQGRLQGKLEQQATFLNSDWRWSLRALDEMRFAGDIDWEEKDRGSTTVYGRDIQINRLEAILIGSWRDASQREWKLSQGWVQHNQDSWYGPTAFNASQSRGIFKLETALNALGGSNRLEGGYTWDQYEDNLNLGVETDRLDRVPHFYYGHSRQLNSQLALDGGLRLEHHASEQVVPLLRGAARWQLHPKLSMQFGAGQAFRQISLFSLDKAVHAGFEGVTLIQELKPERSLSLNYRLNWEHVNRAATYRMSLGLFATEFRDKAVLSYTDQSGEVAYSNAPEAWSRGFMVSKDFNWFNGWRSRIDYNWARVRYLQDENWQEEHMINRWTAGARLDRSFADGRLKTGLKWRMFGPQTLPEGRSRDESPVWYIVDLRIDKHFQGWQLGFDVENLLDWTQPDSPFIRSDDGDLLDSAMIYGPLVGRRFRLRLNFGW